MSTTTLTAPAELRFRRIESIDLLRGTVMILMALDHARDYFDRSAYLFDPTDMRQTTVTLFFTRWVTHFCAPIFMLLAGVSAYLYGMKNGRKALSFFLLTRGIWLILLEMFIVSLGWTFNAHFTVYILQVIWAFGFSMIILSLLIHAKNTWLLVIAILLIGCHDLLDGIHTTSNGGMAFAWAFLHEQRPFGFGPFFVFLGYPLLPWIGLITLGYCLGKLYGPEQDPVWRKKILRRLGWGAIAIFIVIRAIDGYGDPAPWSSQPHAVFSLLSFLNVSKYPPSLLYILVTIGPALFFLSATEGPLNRLSRPISVFGRVPMFFYLVHIYVLHGVAVIAAMLSGHKASDMVNLTTWVTAEPKLSGYGFDLWVVYAVWIGTIFLLYPLCKWFDAYKRSHIARQRWLSYL